MRNLRDLASIMCHECSQRCIKMMPFPEEE